MFIALRHFRNVSADVRYGLVITCKIHDAEHLWYCIGESGLVYFLLFTTKFLNETLGSCNSFSNDPGSGCCLLEGRKLLEYIPSERFIFDTAI